MATPPAIQSRLRSLYRSFLRELPLPPTVSSPLHSRLRTSFLEATPSSTYLPSSSASDAQNRHLTSSSSDANNNNVIQEKIQQAEQYLLYLRSQRTYLSLLERYNPGVAQDVARGRTRGRTRTGIDGEGGGGVMDSRDELLEEDRERVEATARRVGMVLPTIRPPPPGVGAGGSRSGGQEKSGRRSDLRSERRGNEDGD